MAVSACAATMSFMKSRKFDAPSALLVRGRHLAGGSFEGGEQRRGAVALVIVAMAGQRSTVRKLEISLRPLQRLDRRLFVDADDDGVLGRRHVEPDHVGRLGDELGIVALAPGFAPGKVPANYTRSNFVGCLTGIAAGFFPRRILSTILAARLKQIRKTCRA